MRTARRTCNYYGLAEVYRLEINKMNLHISLLHTDKTYGKTLKFTTGKVANVTVRNLPQL